MTKPQTNVELVTQYMEFSRTGALTQCFVIEALDKWSAITLNNQDKLRVSMRDSMINPEAWIAAAAEWQEMSKWPRRTADSQPTPASH